MSTLGHRRGKAYWGFFFSFPPIEDEGLSYLYIKAALEGRKQARELGIYKQPSNHATMQPCHESKRASEQKQT